VIPSYGRPDRLQTNTLAFLQQQRIPHEKIEVWLADGKAPGQDLTELERYQRALAKDWPDVRLRVGVKGIMEQRWNISLSYPEGTHIVSFDDDIPEMRCKWKVGTGEDTLAPLSPGSLEALIHHAYDTMIQQNAYIWGLNSSPNPMNMIVNRISRKNGILNAFTHGYRNRHDEGYRSIYSSAVEDIERSCRYFSKDGVLLRYMMYSVRTLFKAPDGLSLLYSSLEERKAAEDQALQDIAAEFPHLLTFRATRKTAQAMNCSFRIVGQGPLYADGTPKPRYERAPISSPISSSDSKEKFTTRDIQQARRRLYSAAALRCRTSWNELARSPQH